MHISSIIEGCRARLEDTEFEGVRQWKAQHPGRKAVGCFPVYTPVEIIHAAGMLPVGLFGGGTTIELANADARFQSFVCSIAKTTLEMGFQGRLKHLDGAVFSSICDVARNLSSVMARNFPELQVEYIHHAQNMTSPSAIDYLESEFARLQRRMEKLAGRPATQEALASSVKTYNCLRGLLRRLYEIRRNSPSLLSTLELYILMRSGTLVPPEEHVDELQRVLDLLPGRQEHPKDRVRVVIESAFCEQPPLDLLQVVEEAGCYIVDDDLLTGWRWFVEDIPEDMPPLRALAESYIRRSVYSSVRHDGPRPRTAGLVEKVRRARAQAVIFMPAKFCEPALFDYPLFRPALEQAGIPHIVIEFEEKMWTFERTRNELETFVESMLFD
ncbi:MAG: 2-hydroxyacyl-CoA dehydratase [Candidatus Methylomirabilota bacterium]